MKQATRVCPRSSRLGFVGSAAGQLQDEFVVLPERFWIIGVSERQLTITSSSSMEEQLPQRSAATQQAFPPPPAFFKLYREDADGSAEHPLPPKPPEPVQGEYEMFGELHTV